MVDSLILLATGLACIYVVLKAAYLDAVNPWYPKPDEAEKAPTPAPPTQDRSGAAASGKASRSWRLRRRT